MTDADLIARLRDPAFDRDCLHRIAAALSDFDEVEVDAPSGSWRARVIAIGGTPS